jgi:hypothetical protein
MIAWCAAFANFCIERHGGKGSRSASSQSFLSQVFKRTKDPKRGDLVVFTCYEPGTEESIGLGHVTFFKEKVGDNQIRVVGGNQSKDGHSSIISERVMTTTERTVKRHLANGAYVDTAMRLNTYISMT